MLLLTLNARHSISPYCTAWNWTSHRCALISFLITDRITVLHTPQPKIQKSKIIDVLSFQWWKMYATIGHSRTHIHVAIQRNFVSYRCVLIYSHDFVHSSNFPSTEIHHRCLIFFIYTHVGTSRLVCLSVCVCVHVEHKRCTPLHRYLWLPSFIIHSRIEKLQVINERSVWWHVTFDGQILMVETSDGCRERKVKMTRASAITIISSLLKWIHLTTSPLTRFGRTCVQWVNSIANKP